MPTIDTIKTSLEKLRSPITSTLIDSIVADVAALLAVPPVVPPVVTTNQPPEVPILGTPVGDAVASTLAVSATVPSGVATVRIQYRSSRGVEGYKDVVPVNGAAAVTFALPADWFTNTWTLWMSARAFNAAGASAFGPETRIVLPKPTAPLPVPNVPTVSDTPTIPEIPVNAIRVTKFADLLPGIAKANAQNLPLAVSGFAVPSALNIDNPPQAGWWWDGPSFNGLKNPIRMAGTRPRNLYWSNFTFNSCVGTGLEVWNMTDSTWRNFTFNGAAETFHLYFNDYKTPSVNVLLSNFKGDGMTGMGMEVQGGPLGFAPTVTKVDDKGSPLIGPPTSIGLTLEYFDYGITNPLEMCYSFAASGAKGAKLRNMIARMPGHDTSAAWRGWGFELMGDVELINTEVIDGNNAYSLLAQSTITLRASCKATNCLQRVIPNADDRAPRVQQIIEAQA